MDPIELHYDDVAREITIPLINTSGEKASLLELEIPSMSNDGYGFAQGVFER